MPITEPWFVLPNKPASVESVVVLGAGLAGCHTAFELAQRGLQVRLVDAGSTIATGASGNPIAVVRPFVTRSSDATAQFYKAAFNFLLSRLEENSVLSTSAEFNPIGVMHLVDKDYPACSDYKFFDSKQASNIAGVPVNSNALFFERGGHINPHALCAAIVNHPNIALLLNHRVDRIERVDHQWCLHKVGDIGKQDQHKDLNHENTLTCSTLILANGQNLNQYQATQALPIIAARGQTSTFALSKNNSSTLKCVLTGKHYVIPKDDHIIVGATYARDSIEQNLSSVDHAKNLVGLNTALPDTQVEPIAVAGFCGTRATTPDRLPLVGPAPNINAYLQDYAPLKHGPRAQPFANAQYHDNLYLIGGFGSRGVVSAPYCASVLANQMVQGSGLEQDDNSNWSSLLHPARFTIRALKREL